jgi:hypothetical protein
MGMIEAANMVLWINDDTKQVMIAPHRDDDGEFWRTPEKHGFKGHWVDPIGAAYAEWGKMKPGVRVQLMLETIIDLAMQGFDLATLLRAFNRVRQFHDLGSKSYPMCRALIGQCLEPNTMTFEELLVHYRNDAVVGNENSNPSPCTFSQF